LVGDVVLKLAPACQWHIIAATPLGHMYILCGILHTAAAYASYNILGMWCLPRGFYRSSCNGPLSLRCC